VSKRNQTSYTFILFVTVLNLLKGVLYARSSRLIPDKANLGFRFPCDGPGRGGTCQVSAWTMYSLGYSGCTTMFINCDFFQLENAINLMGYS
jgi:hypothetical protein